MKQTHDYAFVKNTLFLQGSLIVKSQQNRIELVTRPGGKKSAKSIYTRKVAPMLQELDVKHEVIFTERSDQAKEYVMENDLDSFDGLVCVGGDGTYAEVRGKSGH